MQCRVLRDSRTYNLQLAEDGLLLLEIIEYGPLQKLTALLSGWTSVMEQLNVLSRTDMPVSEFKTDVFVESFCSLYDALPEFCAQQTAVDFLVATFLRY